MFGGLLKIISDGFVENGMTRVHKVGENLARSAVILGGCIQGEIWREIAYAYGRNLGIAFQVSCCSPFDMMYIYDFFSL